VGGQAPQELKVTADPSSDNDPMAPSPGHDYTDNRLPWDWSSKYPPEARKYINREATLLAIALVLLLVVSGFALCLSGSFSNIAVPISLGSTSVTNMTVDARIVAVFLCGSVGGATFSIKWLVHSVAKGTWHRDRTYWRYFVPLIGGVYAAVVLTLFNSGMIVGHPADPQQGGIAGSASLAFLTGYFSDGVSGLLSNIANAVFGTLREK
jgi:hypothetical protein